jgi:2-dehydro-3-deoxygalactonokinase
MKGSRLCKKGPHRDVFLRQCGRWLETASDALVLLFGMVGNREGWREAPYAICPSGPAEIDQAPVPVDLENGRKG